MDQKRAWGGAGKFLILDLEAHYMGILSLWKAIKLSLTISLFYMYFIIQLDVWKRAIPVRLKKEKPYFSRYFHRYRGKTSGRIAAQPKKARFWRRTQIGAGVVKGTLCFFFNL